MDYGAGGPWLAIKGVHGPYDSLRKYEKCLSSLGIKSLVVEYTEYRPI